MDLLVFAIYPRAFEGAAREYLPFLKKGAIVSDFCGNKRIVTTAMKALEGENGDLVYVGGHPMAGREFSGIEHSSVVLFEKASMILVPVKADIFTLDKIKEFYLSVGFERVTITDAGFHDKVIAYTSELCHIVSNAFILNTVADNRLGYSAGSFRDLTRVARLDPALWTELIALNRDNALSELEELISNLNKYRDAIAKRDDETLKKLFQAGSDRKIKIESDKKPEK